MRETETRQLVTWCDEVSRGSDAFAAARAIAGRLGVQVLDNRVELGCWVPGVEPGTPVFLEVLRPVHPLDLKVPEQRARLGRDLVPLQRCGDFVWGVVEGMRAGHRDRLGDLYRVRYRDRGGTWHAVADCLAASVPFGAFAPAELYDLARLDRERGDRDYFAARGVPAKDRSAPAPALGPPVTLLQLHVPTASEGGTLASLARRYRAIADRLRAGHELSAADRSYIGHDALQLLPIEPAIAHEAGPPCWAEPAGDPTEGELQVALHRPDTTNWGYDVVLGMSSAINPALLESGRPDELVDLCEVLHTFPGRPMGLVLDMVFGHADNQALSLLPAEFFTGPNMYGQDVSYRHPVVRALLLEMQRRKVNFGLDGLRIDGAQDFRYWDATAGELRHDDDYLREISAVSQEVAGQRYRPWIIFEDGRPWPQQDWELASSYREVTAQQPDAFQWGPLTFAHNTPFLYTFWISKWWRLREVARMGQRWITGCANHDTLRRGIQVDPGARINDRLGDSLPAIIAAAYDNPAANLLTIGFLPGVPMDFINAAMRAPWAFIRNTDQRYAAKVVAEEGGFLDWRVDEERFAVPDSFPRLKALGFLDLPGLRRFVRALRAAVELTGEDPEAVARLLQVVEPALPPTRGVTVELLGAFARAWMDDVHELCNVARYEAGQDPARARFNLALRELRRGHPWLADALGPDDVFEHRWPCDGTVLFYGMRRSPDGAAVVVLVANMEGRPVTVTPSGLLPQAIARDGWRALATPGLDVGNPREAVTLHDSQAALFVSGQSQPMMASMELSALEK